MAARKRLAPTGNESSLLQQISAPASTKQGSDEIVIRYQPYAAFQKWVQYRFSAWSTFKAWFAMSLVVIFFGFGGPGTVCKIIEDICIGQGSSLVTYLGIKSAVSNPYIALELIFGILSALALVATAVYAATPTQLRLNYNGIRLEWTRLGLKLAKALPWQQMARIEMFYPAGKTAQQDCVVNFKGNTGSPSLSLKLGAITTVEERSRLQEGIDKWAGDLRRDPHLIEVLKPPVDHSYTELWMQALSAPPKRERLAPLSPQAELEDGRFVVIDQLGVGGQGTAYLARCTDNSAQVVLKEFILPVYVDLNVRRQALERMQKEAAMLRRLDHPRIVRLLDFFVEDHRGYLVLELIDGYSLRKVVEDSGPMPEEQVRSLATQMCEMLEYLHSLSPPVVHRDFTPDNLILGADGVLKLVDFNVAQQTESTATGTVVGKHCYLPPEQFRGKPVPQSDLYAMGATLYFLLIGQDPEPITCSNPILKREDISAEINEIVARATALDVEKRWLNAEQIEAALKGAKTQALSYQA